MSNVAETPLRVIAVSVPVALAIGLFAGAQYGTQTTKTALAARPTQTPVIIVRTRTVVATATPVPGLRVLARLPAGQCVVGMPDEDMRIAVSGHGAQKICRDLMQHPRQGIGPLFDDTTGTSYNPTRITLANKDSGTMHLDVMCQYSLPSTTVRVFDDPGGEYGTRFCGTTIDGIAPVSVG